MELLTDPLFLQIVVFPLLKKALIVGTCYLMGIAAVLGLLLWALCATEK